MRNTHLRPGRIACVLAATALFSAAGATAASAATSDPLGGLTGGLLGGGTGGLPVVGGLLGGSGGTGGLPVVGGLLGSGGTGGTAGLPVVGNLLPGGIPLIGDLEGLPVIGGGALPISPGALPIGGVLNGVPIVGPIVGDLLGGVLDGVTGGGRVPNTGGNTHTGPTNNGANKAPRTSSIHKGHNDKSSHHTNRDHDSDSDSDDGAAPSGGVRAGAGMTGAIIADTSADGPAALPLVLLGVAAIGAAGVGVRRLITARGAA